MSSERARSLDAATRSEPFLYVPSPVDRISAGGEPALPWNVHASGPSSEQREKEAYERGIREGEATSRAAAALELTSVKASISAALEKFKAERAAYFARIEPDVVQLALAIARKILHREAQMDPLLLAGMVRVALERVETGFTRGNVFTFQVALPFSRYNNPASADRFFKNLEDQLRALPGVQAAGAINLLPLGSTSNPFGWASEAAPDQWAAQAADTRIVTPQYFSTMGIKLLSGRLFTEQDDLTRPYEVVVDDVLARRAWPGASALGQKVNMTTFHMNGPPTKEWWHVIGVVQHVHNESLTEEGMLQIYRPLLQDFNLNMTMVVRSEIDPVAMQKAAESILRTLDKDVPLHQAQTIDGYIKIAQTPMAFNLILIGAFGLIALVLASVGLYGVIAYLVSQRTREIGVRIALGAQRQQILRLILGYGLKLTAAGLASGVLISLAVSQVISNQLFEVKATDLATYILTPAVLAFVAMLASYFPSRRAARLDPMDALRYDGQ